LPASAPVVVVLSAGLQSINEMVRVQHQSPLPDLRGARPECSTCEEPALIIAVHDATSGGLAGLPRAPRSCPGCSGRLRPWGYARPRAIRQADGARLLVRPRRVRCAGCQVTHVVLPAASVPRRADAAEVIGSALLAKAAGRGHRTIAAELGASAGTVRGWLRRATARAGSIRAAATRVIAHLDPLWAPMNPAGGALADAVNALGAAIAAAIRRLGRIAPPWQLAVTITGGLLTPVPSG
jgi:hypothetical protein